jgi:hypothetical protein
VKLVAHLNGEHYDTYNLYHDLKKHVLAFTVEQLSHDVLLQYMMAIQRPVKWCGTSFQVVLHWYERIKIFMWLRLIELMSTRTLCLLQGAVEKIIVLEYK